MRRQESCARHVRLLELALQSLACRDELTFRKEGERRYGRVKYRVALGGQRSVLLVLDFDAGELCLPKLISRIDTRAAWFKSWSAGQRRAVTDDIAVVVVRGALSLRITVREGAVARCAGAILQRANQIIAEVNGAIASNGSQRHAEALLIGDAPAIARRSDSSARLRAEDNCSAASG